MNIAILGTGAYGIALALKFHNNGNKVKMWTKFKDEQERIVKKRCNERALPGIIIPTDIEITTEIEEAVKDAKIIVITVPSSFVSDVTMLLKEVYTRDKYVLIASKGIEKDTSMFMADIFRKYIRTYKYAILSGPSFAIDMANNCPIGLTVASEHRKTRQLVIEALSQDTVKIRESSDVVGVEICAALKNVIALAAGILDGLGYPESTQAMFITEEINDIKELIKKFGGDKQTIMTYAGFGDILLTATSKKSRNYTFGRLLGEKKSRKEIDEYVFNTTVEGLDTVKSIYRLLQMKRIKMEVIELIHDIVEDEKEVDELPKYLINKK